MFKGAASERTRSHFIEFNSKGVWQPPSDNLATGAAACEQRTGRLDSHATPVTQQRQADPQHHVPVSHMTCSSTRRHSHSRQCIKRDWLSAIRPFSERPPFAVSRFTPPFRTPYADPALRPGTQLPVRVEIPTTTNPSQPAFIEGYTSKHQHGLPHPRLPATSH